MIDNDNLYDYKETLAINVRKSVLSTFDESIILLWHDLTLPESRWSESGASNFKVFFQTESNKTLFLDSDERERFEKLCQVKLFELDAKDIYSEKLEFSFEYDSDERIHKEDDGDYFKGAR